jgi:serine/threonine protein phosphatase PrpC
MNSFSSDFVKTFTSQIGQELYSEIARASWNAMPPVAIADLTLAIGTSTGSVRQRNEDRVAVAQISGANGEIYFVALACDGVGGSEMGDVAASMAIAVFLDELVHTRLKHPLATLLPRLIRRVDDRVRDALQGKGATTISVLIAAGEGEIAATNVGDSRIYAWTPLKDKLIQISRDDTMENELSDLALKDPSALRFRGLGGSLSQAIGESGRTRDELRIKLLDSEYFSDGVVLATDGAWKGAEDGFNAVLKKAPSSTAAVSRALSLATWSGGFDNASIIAIEKVKEAVANIPKFPIGMLKVNVWLGNTKVVLSGVDSITNVMPSEDERPIMKSDIRKALRKKYVRSSKAEPKTPEQLNFKIADDSAPTRKKDARAKIEISIDSDQSQDTES